MSDDRPTVRERFDALPKRGKAGRPSKLTEELIEEVCAPLRITRTIKSACIDAGITLDTYYRWLKQGNLLRHGLAGDPGFRRITEEDLTANDELLLRFSEAVARAEDEGYTRIVGGMLIAGTRPFEEVRTVEKFSGKFDDQNRPIMVTERTVTIKQPDWHALESLGVRRYRDELALKQQVELSGPEGGAIPIEAWAAAVEQRIQALDDNVIEIEPRREALGQ